jgi:hypothetical protein
MRKPLPCINSGCFILFIQPGTASSLSFLVLSSISDVLDREIDFGENSLSLSTALYHYLLHSITLLLLIEIKSRCFSDYLMESRIWHFQKALTIPDSDSLRSVLPVAPSPGEKRGTCKEQKITSVGIRWIISYLVQYVISLNYHCIWLSSVASRSFSIWHIVFHTVDEWHQREYAYSSNGERK